MKRSTLLFLLLSSFCLSWSGSLYASGTPMSVYKKTSDSVVLIFSMTQSGRGSSMGTGWVIDESGLVMTNAHVVDLEGRPGQKIVIVLKPQRLTGDSAQDLNQRYKGTFLGWDKERDLALLKIEGLDRPLRPFKMAKPSSIEIGEPVVAIGHPGGGGAWTLTSGYISSLRKNAGNIKGKDVYQTDANLNPGNSGGPLIDMDGNVVGMNTMIYRKNRQGLAITGINFALQSQVIKKWLDQQNLPKPITWASPSSTHTVSADHLQTPVQPVQADTESKEAIQNLKKKLADLKKREQALAQAQAQQVRAQANQANQANQAQVQSAKHQAELARMKAATERARAEAAQAKLEAERARQEAKQYANQLAEERKRLIKNTRRRALKKPKKVRKWRQVTPRRPFNVEKVKKTLRDYVEASAEKAFDDLNKEMESY